jgi:hypothetical protein
MLVSEYHKVELAKQKYEELLATSRMGPIALPNWVCCARRGLGRRLIAWGQRMLENDRKYQIRILAH